MKIVKATYTYVMQFDVEDNCTLEGAMDKAFEILDEAGIDRDYADGVEVEFI